MEPSFDYTDAERSKILKDEEKKKKKPRKKKKKKND